MTPEEKQAIEQLIFDMNARLDGVQAQWDNIESRIDDFNTILKRIEDDERKA